MLRCRVCQTFVPDWQTRCRCGSETLDPVTPIATSTGPESLVQIKDRILSRLVVTQE